jgi:hypothetical protein
VLYRVSPSSFYNFTYKDMDETVGPGAYHAPRRVLEALTPTEHEYANQWRARCWANLELEEAKPRVHRGDRIRFAEPFTFSGGLQTTTDTVFEVIERDVLRLVDHGLRVKIPGGARAASRSRSAEHAAGRDAGIPPRTAATRLGDVASARRSRGRRGCAQAPTPSRDRLGASPLARAPREPLRRAGGRVAIAAGCEVLLPPAASNTRAAAPRRRRGTAAAVGVRDGIHSRLFADLLGAAGARSSRGGTETAARPSTSQRRSFPPARQRRLIQRPVPVHEALAFGGRLQPFVELLRLRLVSPTLPSRGPLHILGRQARCLSLRCSIRFTVGAQRPLVRIRFSAR